MATEGKEKQVLNEADFSWDNPNMSFFGVTADGKADVKQPKGNGPMPDPDKKIRVGVTLDEDGDEAPEDDESVNWDDFGYNNRASDEDTGEDEEDEEEEKPTPQAKKKALDDDDEEEETPRKPGRPKGSKTSTPPDDAPEGDAVYKLFATELRDRKIFRNAEIPDKVGEDDLYQFMDDELEARLEEALDEYDEALKNNPEAIALLRFMKNGGNTSDFIAAYGQSKLPSEADLKKENVRDAFLRQYYMEVEGLDVEDTEDKLEWLKESGKADKFAIKHFREVQEGREQAQLELQQAQYQRKKQAEQNVMQFRETIKKTVTDADVIGDIKLSPKDKRELPDYISKHTVKASPTQLVTQLQKDIADIFGDPQSLIILAKFVRGGLKAGEFEAAKASSKVGAVKQTLRDAMEGRKSQAPSKKSGKSLADAWGSRG